MTRLEIMENKIQEEIKFLKANGFGDDVTFRHLWALWGVFRGEYIEQLKQKEWQKGKVDDVMNTIEMTKEINEKPMVKTIKEYLRQKKVNNNEVIIAAGMKLIGSGMLEDFISEYGIKTDGVNVRRYLQAFHFARGLFNPNKNGTMNEVLKLDYKTIRNTEEYIAKTLSGFFDAVGVKDCYVMISALRFFCDMRVLEFMGWYDREVSRLSRAEQLIIEDAVLFQEFQLNSGIILEAMAESPTPRGIVEKIKGVRY